MGYRVDAQVGAKQRKLPLAGPPINGYRRRDGTAAVPPEAESQRSSAMGHYRPYAIKDDQS
jgi:hypothetical protein